MAELAALVKQARSGDAEAYGELVNRFSAAVRGMCLMRAADPARADDIAQQVFLTAWKRLPDLNEDAPFWPWLEAITRNHLLNEWRRVQRERGLKQRYTVAWLAQSESEHASEDAEDLALRVEVLRQCVETLPEKLRSLIRMRYDDGYSSEEIAVVLGRTSDAVRQTFVRVRDKLRECVERKLSSQGAI
ncbi:MAG TPA: sigma-70 family RNA polymerase sigma factor [Planctomycetota bacterium]|nr:sigma-70 family RNA polymerase sigma factor [Planctomycetota bacterium]